LDRRRPKKTRASFPQSTTEWIASEAMAEEPVAAAARNLTVAISRFAATAT
jgi:hypothetical protein